MQRFTEGDRVRVDTPDETDPDHEVYHGKEGTVIGVPDDEAGEATGDGRDSVICRVELASGDASTSAGGCSTALTGGIGSRGEEPSSRALC